MSTDTDFFAGGGVSDESMTKFEEWAAKIGHAPKLPVRPPTDPPGNAALFLEYLFDHPERWTLIYHRGQYFSWNGRNWEPLAADVLQAMVSKVFRQAEYFVVPPGTKKNPNPAPVPKPFVVNRDALSNIMLAIQNHVIISDKIDANSWIEPQLDDPTPDDLVPLQNGLLNTRTRQLMQTSPRYFNHYALQFDYDAHAAQPVEWFGFIDSVFNGDLERRALLQEMIGYLCTPSRKLQKMFDLIGPPRSGKGTIARLVERLVGRENYGATSLSSLGGAHGLQTIATKPVVVLGDAAFVGNNGGHALERLLQIIGEDIIEVNPKGKAPYHATLPCRFMLLANDLPVLPDKSQALRARILVLKFTESFVGREDRKLDEKLAMELPAIFNWALDGLDRLLARGEFVQPQAGLDDLQLVSEMAAPEISFVRDLCDLSKDVGVEVRESTDLLYMAWVNWCKENGIKNIGDKKEMGKALRRVARDLKPGKMPRDESGKQANATIGIALKADAKKQYAMTTPEFELSRIGGGFGGLVVGR